MLLSAAPSLYAAISQIARTGSFLALSSVTPLLIGAAVTVWRVRAGALLLTALWVTIKALPYYSNAVMLFVYAHWSAVPSGAVAIMLAASALLANADWVLGLVAAAVCALAMLPAAYHSAVMVDYEFALAAQSGFTFVLFLFFALAGVTWRLRNEHRLRKREQDLLSRQRERIATANHLHNAICNDLTYLLFITEQQNRDDPDIVEMKSTIRRTLADVRAMIASLESDAQEIGESLPSAGAEERSGDEGSWNDLQDAISGHDGRLASLGFAGGSLPSIPREVWEGIPAPIRRFTISALDELYGNIAKYANKDRGWCVSLCVVDGMLHMKSSNVIRGDAGAAEPLLSGRSGLKRLRKLAAPLGGHVQVSSEDGRWLCAVDVPLNAH
ncbi:hypothetical protein JS528_05200 [Bifidobacterium sp. MA2]|uniref:Signal transduction histidine kinase n=1 Tax=Bifidobacterium santillanense TaxID=2809028 RepID=A0ABS5UP91_9BIFI|nr:hypothetical protein [Bifidobacterium santillanense]MBT1172758.1 hypothetical protein [Bifidobacterium santillanense]